MQLQNMMKSHANPPFFAEIRRDDLIIRGQMAYNRRGIGMSGLAQMLQHLGYQVTGSDQNDGYLMNDVRQAGAKVTIGHCAENVHGADLVVYTAAIPLTNPERAEAERLHIPSMERAELLGQLMRHYARAIGICGAHGKTTTTSMLSEILVAASAMPSAVQPALVTAIFLPLKRVNSTARSCICIRQWRLC